MNFAFTAGRWLMRVRPAPLAVLLKRILRVHRQILTTTEGRFWVDPASFSGQELAQHGIYDPGTLGVIKTLLGPGETFIDVGANEGYFSVVAARLVGPQGRVIAVEPQARLASVLRRNFALNHCAEITIISAAVADHVGDAQLFLTPDVNTGASGLTAHTRYPLKTQRVATTTLAALFESCRLTGRVVMKMDIEGWEQEAILGSAALFRERRIAALVLEHHGSLIAGRGQDPEEVPRFLSECGYRTASLAGGLAWILPRSAV